MHATARHRLALATLLALGASGWARGAQALQPLQTFIDGAKQGSPRLAEAVANSDVDAGLATTSIGRVLPSLAVTAALTRNQYQAELEIPHLIPKTVIQPYNQGNGVLTLSVPLVNVANFVRIAAARATAGATRRKQDATALQVASQVTQTYYQLVAYVALVSASEHALAVAQASLALTRDRYDVGAAATLDVDRAQADTERQVQQLAEARLQADISARTLTSLTRVTPSIDASSGTAPLLDDLSPAAALDPDDADIPSIAAAYQSAHALRRSALAEWLVLLPSITGTATGTLSNVPGFTGHGEYYAVAANLTWKLDPVVFGDAHAARGRAAAADARAEQARRDGRDDLYRFGQTITAYIARSRSAREQARVSAEAARLAAERYGAGTATQLDLLQAQRDAFAADVTRIQADADLVNARAQLRFAAGLLDVNPDAKERP